MLRVPSSRELLLGPWTRPLSLSANGCAVGAPPSYSANQWRRRKGNALLPRGPMAACPGSRAAPAWPLAPPRSPLTRCLVALSSCSKPRGRVGGCCGPGRTPHSRASADGAHMATQAHSLSYAGCNFLRQRLVLSTLSGRPVKIRRIRARDDNPGLRGDLGGSVGPRMWGLSPEPVRGAWEGWWSSGGGGGSGLGQRHA